MWNRCGPLGPLGPLALAVLLCGCGSHTSPGPAAAAPGAQHRAAAGPAAKASDGVDPDLVGAVSTGAPEPAITLRFRLDARPVVGQPVQLLLALAPTPGAGIVHIHGALQSGDELQIQSPRSFDVDVTPDGTVPSQPVTVIPRQPGVLSLTAVLSLGPEGSTPSRTYLIPLIATAATP